VATPVVRSFPRSRRAPSPAVPSLVRAPRGSATTPSASARVRPRRDPRLSVRVAVTTVARALAASGPVASVPVETGPLPPRVPAAATGRAPATCRRGRTRA
jgi:hypothetical protein